MSKDFQENREKTAGEITGELLMNSPTFEEVTLDKMRIAVQRQISSQMLLESMDVRTHMNYLTDSMAVALMAYVLGNKVHEEKWHETETITSPDGWFEMLKFEKPWLQNIFGKPKMKSEIRTKALNYTHNHVCPHADIPWKTGSATHINFMVQNDHPHLEEE